MKRIVRFTVAMTMTLAASASAGALGAQLYVASNGNDTNPGTLEKPFATLQRAQQAARKVAGREAVAIFIRDGIYYLPETLVFTTADSGTKTAPVVWQAYQKEQPVISGGTQLRNLRWEPYKDGIMRAKVPAGFATDQLFVNGESQPLARYPNFDPKARIFHGTAADAFSPERAARWKNPAGGVIHVLHAAAWGSLHYLITGKGTDNKVTYDIYNNLFLRGGIKNREGFYRVVENNIMLNNGFHPHCWYKHSADIFRRNILGIDHYLPAGGMPATPWGKEIDNNLVHGEGLMNPRHADALSDQSNRDEHSMVGDAMFIDPAKGDFRVKDGSPALKLGFVNFPMDQFGVRKPELKAIARTPEIPQLEKLTVTPESRRKDVVNTLGK